MKLIRTEILLEPLGVSIEDEDECSGIELRKKYAFEFIPCYLAKDKIVEFHPSREFPYETNVTFSDGTTNIINTEFNEFAKLYEQ